MLHLNGKGALTKVSHDLVDDAAIRPMVLLVNEAVSRVELYVSFEVIADLIGIH